MSTETNNLSEDFEMKDFSNEKIVTMVDVLQEQTKFEEDANAVLGASDYKNCTYNKGYVKRQAIYACLTCCSSSKDDPTKRAGVCLACSLNCHENHDLIELYTKRNFRCDCGNPKFNAHPCQFTTDKTEFNEENNYNQNFIGQYCVCQRPYPDPDVTEEDEMIQCIICEDWLHSAHLEATLPDNSQYSEMICKACMEKNDFLSDYCEFAVTDSNVDMADVSISNVTSDNSKLEITSVESIRPTTNETETSVSEESSSINNISENINDESISVKTLEDDKNMETSVDQTNEDKLSETITTDKKLDTNFEKDIESAETIVEQAQAMPESFEKIDGALLDSTQTEQSLASETNTSMEGNVNNISSENIDNKDSMEANDNNVSSENIDNDNKENAAEVTDETLTKETDNTNINVSGIDIIENPDELKEKDGSDKIDNNTDEKLLDETEDDITNKTDTALENNDTEEEESKVNEVDKDQILPEESEADKDQILPEKSEVNLNENKRKFENTESGESSKKVKLDTNGIDCIRPKGVKKQCNGATFWPADFRQRLCTCSECISMYKDLSLLFLTDPEDTVSFYESLGQEKANGASSQYEKGLEALSSLDRVQQINALTEYNNMRDKLLDFLKSFKDRREIVREEDIKAFFAGMKAKREPDGVYFCR